VAIYLKGKPFMATVSGDVYIKWVDSFLMTGIDSRGNPLTIGAREEHEPKWQGLKASDLLLLAAASCASHDVVMILKKQREPLAGLDVRCTGEQETDPPYQFTHIHLHYIFRGNLDPERVAKAIRLSEEKYCCVTNTLKAALDITSDFEIQG
jgi:putative redox protein